MTNTLESLRWMKCLVLKNEFTIVVNIPSATLLLFKGDSIVLESKVIVGKKTTRTPMVASFVTDITLYPYWMVPKSIATKELLPEIQKDINYLGQNNFQVLDLNGRIVNPYAIDWHQLSKTYFPYIIRQSTGCDNSLGLIKLNINNPFNIYLHDTPGKALFESKNRFFSHGCVRVEQAKALSHFLLKENAVAVDTLNENETGFNHNPIVLGLKDKVPVIVVYQPAWFSKDGTVTFYSDIYGKFTNY